MTRLDKISRDLQRGDNTGSDKKKIAIAGSGISGLSAAWHLHTDAEVTLFEANDWLGGHAHTVNITLEDVTFPVDTGFIVFNPKNYPNLTALFALLGVQTMQTDMSFSVSVDDGAFEYASDALFAQPGNLFKGRFWSVMAGIARFYKNAKRYVADDTFKTLTLRDMLVREGYSTTFIRDYLAPMGAAIWSSNSIDILDYPAHAFLTFFNNHGLVQPINRPVWHSVMQGSCSYVKKIVADLEGKVKINLQSRVSGVVVNDGKVDVYCDDQKQTFDHVILACHSDQACQLLWNSAKHRMLLEPIRYGQNTVVLHSDISLMPKRTKAWASWNYIGRSAADAPRPAVSYWMNRLQDLPVKTPVIVTLNPDRPVDPETIYGEFAYDHPVFDRAAQDAKQELWSIQGEDNIWLAGAYLGDGFHEDGIQSGLAVSECIGARRRPWHVPGQNSRIGLPDLLPLANGMRP